MGSYALPFQQIDEIVTIDFVVPLKRKSLIMSTLALKIGNVGYMSNNRCPIWLEREESCIAVCAQRTEYFRILCYAKNK